MEDDPIEDFESSTEVEDTPSPKVRKKRKSRRLQPSALSRNVAPVVQDFAQEDWYTTEEEKEAPNPADDTQVSYRIDAYIEFKRDQNYIFSGDLPFRPIIIINLPFLANLFRQNNLFYPHNSQ